MQFLFPTFLFALAALAIPIILHLFYFRRFKKVYFTNVRFLKEVKEETSARSRLRNLLVLLMRLLAIAFLILAFAQPFIPQDVEVKQGTQAVSLFVDNSFSMNALSQDIPLIDKAKQRAREIVDAYSPEDRFQIITNDFEGRHQRLVSKEEALGLIEEIVESPTVRKLSEVAVRQKQVFENSEAENQVAYMLSDFQRNITDIENYADTTIETNLVPFQSVQEQNISIDSAWFDAPVQMINQTNSVIVRVKNHTKEAVENIRLSIQYEGQEKPVGTLSVPAGGSVLDTVNITILRTGWHEAILKITDYPIQFDDTYFFSFYVAEQINLLVINESETNRYLNAAFAGAAYFELTNGFSKNLDYSQLPNYELIVVNDLISISSGLAFELKQYAENGGNILVFPNRNADVESYRRFFGGFPANEYIRFEDQERVVGDMNTDEFIFQDVFENKSANLKLPTTRGNFRMNSFNNRLQESLMRYRDGSTYLSKYRVGQGHLYSSAAPLAEQYNDLVRNGEIFIPMLYKMAISSSRNQRIAYTIGADEVLEADHRNTSSETVYKLKGATGEFIPEQRVISSKVFLGLNQQLNKAGFYDLFLRPEETIGKYAFNFNRLESELAYFNESDLASYVGPNANIISINDAAVLTAKIEERSRGIVLWRWCLIIALIFLAIEVLLLRFWRV